MCNCNQNSLKPEFELMAREAGNNSEFSFSTNQQEFNHPDLGPGRLVSKQNEFKEYESGTDIFHPSLGRGKSVPRTDSINSEAELIGVDERKQMFDTKAVPFRWICHLKLLFPDPDNSTRHIEYGGSGTLISPRHILTAGHCLFTEVEGSAGTRSNLQVEKVIAVPGRKNSSPGPFGSATGTKFHYTSLWKSSQNPRFDFGLITLSEDIGSKKMSALGGKVLGHWGSVTNGSSTRINPKEKNTLKGASVNVCGFPADKPLGTQWHAYGKIVNTAPAAGAELIYYDMDTCAGHSGAPVWLRWKEFRNLIAIHTGPCIAGSDCSAISGTPCFPDRQRMSSNRGVFITPAVMSQIKAWMV